MGCSPAAIAWVGALLAAVPVSAVIAFNGCSRIGVSLLPRHLAVRIDIRISHDMHSFNCIAPHLRDAPLVLRATLCVTDNCTPRGEPTYPRKFGFQKAQKPETGYCLSNIQSVSGSIVNPLAKRRSTSSAAVRLAPRRRSGRCRSRCACRSTCTCPGDRRTRCSARPWPWPRTGRTVPCPHPC